MAKILFIAPASVAVGLTSVCLGLLRAYDSVGLRVAFFKPFAQPRDNHHETDRSIVFTREKMGLTVPDPMPLRYAHSLMSQQQTPLLMEQTIALFHKVDTEADVVIVEGVAPPPGDDYSARLNVEVARNLDAEVILVAAPDGMPPQDLDDHLSLAARLFADPSDPDVVGCVLNKVHAPHGDEPPFSDDGDEDEIPAEKHDYGEECNVFRQSHFRLIASIPWRADLVAPRTSDIVEELEAEYLNEGKSRQRRVLHTTVCARTIPNMVSRLKPGALIITPGDREDIFVTSCAAALTGIPLAGLLLTGGLQPDPRTLKLCQSALDTGLPVLSTRKDTYVTASMVSRMDTEVPLDDMERIESVIASVSGHIDPEWLKQSVSLPRKPRMSPAAFRYQLSKRAKEANKTIILPEGNEPRTIQAATICHDRGIAKCILIGKRQEILAVAEAQGVQLSDAIQIIEPDQVREKYISPMVELRKHKGLTPQMAEAQLEDNVVLATMMLALGEVDGLVSGAVHTTANTVRPALQLIKARKGCRIVSSVFFMCLPEQVLVYGDCAINPDPDAEELADIALQCADSAVLFGIEPCVAMLSYSTGDSGSGSDVDKVRAAAKLAHEKRPDLPLDGPLQYDAAAIEDVAKTKAPDSKVAGKATVFVFPDLNTGNTTYKAVQRSANVISMGPMLQGLKKPVNDLSRGALVEDIVYTIALTAVQATQNTEVMEN
ncbi:phosphate acetyltransferase [Hahella sp. KA22]|uniref:phosphate acetyltransferase n=1 Tax=Hahella sp. KA22 TaxID=1628392 RepID=UPI000FDEF2F0|nr:phosphate acetyltransferase [Hahella sp. KA22]AZZ93310.1 phosphate acetyltransferase [Hahella sp. KA22]QAY56684.1 phosphate acetyltransferase [Hahella sp. KA22]